MEWSAEQERAMAKARAWLDAGYDERDPLHYIAGYAGVGKTTMAKEIAQQFGQALFAAYTGKAAYVLRSKGCTDARTIHSLIYKPAGETKSDELRRVERALEQLRFDPPADKTVANAQLDKLMAEQRHLLMTDKKRPMFTLNQDSELNDCDVLVVDECSMVDEQMGVDLISFRKPIIVLGDPMQLPPVGSGGFLVKRTPNSLLVEIHRQARDSGILRLATDIRTTGYFTRTPGHYGADCMVGSRTTIPDYQKRHVEADQILVGLNATRHVSNARIRELTQKGPGLLPIGGDKIVCLRNNAKAGLLNGSLWRVHEAVEAGETVEMSISSEEDGGLGVTISSWTHHFYGTEAELKLKRWNVRDHEEFDFGYALTVHKAQGSQWNSVVMHDESRFFRNEAQRWLYTGVTRAAKSLTLVV